MNNIFTNKKIYEMLGKSKGPGKLTDLSGDGKVTQKDVLIGRGVLPEPPKSGGPAKTRAEMRLEKTKMKAQKAKDATKGKKSSESKEVIRQANKAKRLDKKAKRQEGRAERKKIRKADLSRGDKRKQIIDSRTKQKAKNTVVKKPKTEITKEEKKRQSDIINKDIVKSPRQKEKEKNTTTTIEGKSTMSSPVRISPARRKTSKKEIRLSKKLKDTGQKSADHYFDGLDDKNYNKKQDRYERKELRVEQKLDKEKRKQSRKSFDLEKDPNKKDIRKANKQERKDLKGKQKRYEQRRKEKESA